MGHDMGQVLGGLMSAIAEARSISDRASRDLAVLYEKDELMRVFPVPCVELENVEVDLKFALETKTDPSAPAISLPQDFEAREKDLVYDSAIATRTKVLEAMMSTLRRLFVFRIGFDTSTVGQAIQDTVVVTIRNPTHLVISTKPQDPIKLTAFDSRQVATRVIYILLERGHVGMTKINQSIAINELVNVLAPVASAHESRCVELRDLMFREQNTSDFPMNLLMQHSELAGLPAECVSSIKITVNVANYEWTKVDEKNGAAICKLVRE